MVGEAGGAVVRLLSLSGSKGSILGSYPHLFAALLSVTAPAPRHRSPAAQPSGVDARDARTRVRARESARVRVHLRGRLRRTQRRGRGRGRAGPGGRGQPSSPVPRRGVVLSPPAPRRPGGFPGFRGYPSQGWGDSKSLLRRGDVGVQSAPGSRVLGN